MKIYKQLILFFIPVLIGTFVQQLYSTVDTIIVGRFVGTLALASIGGSVVIITEIVISFLMVSQVELVLLFVKHMAKII